MGHGSRFACGAAILALGLTSSGLAHADVDIPRADALFNEGLALKATNLDAACTKFEASLELNPQALGTLLNVALCDEKQGRIASAVAKFSEARDRAQEQSLSEYVAAADEHLAALRPEVPHLAIRFAVPPGPGTKLLVDSQVILLDGSVDLAAVPVDPGARTVAVSAPGRVAFETRVTVAQRDRLTVDVPELERAVVVKSSRRAIGRITVAAGAGTLIAGVVMGYLAKQRYDALFEPMGGCVDGDPPLCTLDAQADSESAHTLGSIGTVVGVVGIGAIVVGSYLWLTAPSASAPRERAVQLVPTVTPGSAGLAALGRF